MRIAPLVLAFGLVAGCRPLDAGAPISDADLAQSTGGPRGPYQVGQIRVVDGDTFVMNGETIRIANIDTPETGSRAECLAEAQLGAVATQALKDALGAEYVESGRTILPTLQREGRDRYGRTLATVTLATGGDAGERLIERGVAARWTGRRADWCARA